MHLTQALFSAFLFTASVRAARVEDAKFSYTGAKGPLGWAGLSSTHANDNCSTSATQSPINLNRATAALAREQPVMAIPDVAAATLENLGTTVEVAVAGTTAFGGKNYTLSQFHFHTPSEHRIDEEHYPLEMHMVHQAADGARLVLGTLFQLTANGSTTALLTAATKNIKQLSANVSHVETGALAFQPIIKHFKTELFQYSGSLTTPPCTPGVAWLVARKPLNLDVKTYNALKKVMKFNARYTQNNPGDKNLIKVAASQLPIQK